MCAISLFSQSNLRSLHTLHIFSLHFPAFHKYSSKEDAIFCENKVSYFLYLSIRHCWIVSHVRCVHLNVHTLSLI